MADAKPVTLLDEQSVSRAAATDFELEPFGSLRAAGGALTIGRIAPPAELQPSAGEASYSGPNSLALETLPHASPPSVTVVANARSAELNDRLTDVARGVASGVSYELGHRAATEHQASLVDSSIQRNTDSGNYARIVHPANDAAPPASLAIKLASYGEALGQVEDAATAPLEPFATSEEPIDTPAPDAWESVYERPEWLRRPRTGAAEPIDSPVLDSFGKWVEYSRNAPTGYSGKSSVVPSEPQISPHFVPIEDRWRIGYPEWDRYGRDHPPRDDYPYALGAALDPYRQNVLKGDYPIAGQHTFLTITATELALLEFRQIPTPTTPFESTRDPFQEEFFGDPDQFFFADYVKLSVDLLHGDAAFKPADWRIRLTPVYNVAYLDVDELAIVNPNVERGKTRLSDRFALEEWFAETKIADLSTNYDFLSIRGGSQFFTSDFRGFVFSDVNRGLRLFGTRLANRDQFNLIFFDQTEKDTNSLLNTFDDRHQNTLIANYFRQDFIWPGYTSELSFHYNRDGPSFEFDKNGFLVRPDPVGVFREHQVNSFYLGWAGDGHINRFNISHAFYWVLGRDNLNPLAGREISINAQMAAVELSYDRDWARFRTSFFWASGDGDIFDGEGEGFDTILDNPNFAGGEFSYWQRQQIPLFGVSLVNRMSLVPDLRSSKFQGQSNFVNPGLFLANVGFDADITPKCKLISNVNFLWFDSTRVLEQFVFTEKVSHDIGTDMSLGIEYRPLLNNNVILVGGVSGLLPGKGFEDLYNPLRGDVDGLFASFFEVALTY